jgi:hypothetical protein
VADGGVHGDTGVVAGHCRVGDAHGLEVELSVGDVVGGVLKRFNLM